MASTFETVAEIIADSTDVELSDITPDSHVMKDLGVDSLAFLDITFEIDQRFKIKIPIEDWMQQVNQNQADSDEFFVIRNLCKRIEALAAQTVAA